MRYSVQILKSEPAFLRKHWHQVEAGDTKDAVVRLLRKNSGAVPRLARVLGGDAWAAVVPAILLASDHRTRHGMPIMVQGFDVRLGKVG